MQLPSVLLTGSPGAQSIQLEATEDDSFAKEMRTASSSSESAPRELSKQTSEATIPLEAKEPKRRGRPRKEHNKSGRSHREEHLTRQSRDESD